MGFNGLVIRPGLDLIFLKLNNINNMNNEEKEIMECHRADVENGLTESEASESDAFERRVMGMDEPEEIEDYSGPIFKRGKCTRCKRGKNYCEC